MILDQQRAIAREALPFDVWRYLEARADEGTHAEAAWRRWRLRPRILRGVGAVDVSTTLLGETIDLPILLAPAGRSTRYHAEGELATVNGAAQAGTIALLPSSIAHDAKVPAAAGRAWQQLYILSDRAAMRRRLAEAEAIGIRAIVLTVDLLPGAAGEMPPPPRAAWETGRATSAASLFCGATLDDLADICAATRLPVLVKGILRGDDARACLAAGAAGLIVSNHGGNQLAGAVSSAAALPEVVECAGGRGIVLVDGGVRSGSDILKALALGADAVLLGRPTAYALAAGGSAGVTALLAGLGDALARAMALCGIARLADIHRSLVTIEDI
ncbi:alpha-hydroxy acid oxidase [Sphingomonas profundi]|uniref:alpha-hydroxy acid oxidase n=1 Tax=Alterirhizorhabdus profundi TaxID=2681549 RepID=UPI0018D0C4D5|nr:alpha-hydroxy acid oxidase [Sphingomonas profundi]